LISTWSSRRTSAALIAFSITTSRADRLLGSNLLHNQPLSVQRLQRGAAIASRSSAHGYFSASFPPAWLVGSTARTRTAFRVLWRPIRAAISVNFGRLTHVSGLIERECQDASIKPLTWGSGPLLTKIGVFPLGCPDTLVWGARAAKSPGTV
jgi:hypothetical protein